MKISELWSLILGNTVLNSFPSKSYWCKCTLHLSSVSESSVLCLEAHSGRGLLDPGKAKGSNHFMPSVFKFNCPSWGSL